MDDVETQAVDRRSRKHSQRKAELVAAAWELARQRGLAGISQREVAECLDLVQSSLYTYFASKNDLYDAMFADGNRTLLERMEALELPGDPVEALKEGTREVVRFFTEDPMRYQLLYQRTLPGFEPSPEAYALAQQFYEWHRRLARAAGIRTQAQMDVFVALVAGLTDVQLANEPDGNRWVKHLDWVLDMYLREIANR
jgi:AcrR family transcriptional regulator